MRHLEPWTDSSVIDCCEPAPVVGAFFAEPTKRFEKLIFLIVSGGVRVPPLMPKVECPSEN